MKNISAKELKKVAESGVIIDVREPNEFAQDHISKAINVPLSNFQENLSKIPKDKKLFVICRSGFRSAQATEFLIAKGYDAINVDGGMLDFRS